jgi:hypothetical protein
LYDVFLAKYDTNGNQVWIQQFGTSGSDNAFGIDIDSDGFIYLTGYTTGDLGGTNAGGDSVGAEDAFLAKFDSDGNLLGISQFGTSEVDRSWGIDARLLGKVYLSGFTEGSLGGFNAGSFDAWVTEPSIEEDSILPTSVPEPSSLFSILAFLASGVVLLPKRSAIKQKY